MTKKRILCFGDSNTWGYIPGKGERYEEEIRWTGILAHCLGEDYRVIEEGLNGRTTVFSDLIEPERCGITHLRPVILSQLPLDYMIIMLGTNDTKTHFHVNAMEIGYGMEEVLIKARHILDIQGSKARIILVAPPQIHPSGDPMFNRESEEKSLELSGIYRELAEKWDCCFFDAESVTGEPGEDGIHMTEESHRVLGKELAEIIKGMEEKK